MQTVEPVREAMQTFEAKPQALARTRPPDTRPPASPRQSGRPPRIGSVRRSDDARSRLRNIPIGTQKTPATGQNRGGSTDRPSSATEPLLDARGLPGPMSVRLLDGCGVLRPLDDTWCYLSRYARTLFGRGIIMTNLVPSRSTACSLTAAWVWLGGELPDSIDVLSRSHYRSTVCGRAIRTYDRKVTAKQTRRIGDLAVTSPARTACDVILLARGLESDDVDDWNGRHRDLARETACALMTDFHFKPQDCLDILDENRGWPGAPQARRFFESIRYCF